MARSLQHSGYYLEEIAMLREIYSQFWDVIDPMMYAVLSSLALLISIFIF
jgi:hypothetical protein